MNGEEFKSVEDICKHTWKPLYRYIYYKVQNQEETEDITQETYAKSLGYPKFKEIEPNKCIAFFKTVALNIIKDRWRQNKSRGTNIDIASIAPIENAVEDLSDITNEQLLIKSSLEQLNEDQGKVIELRILKGFSVSETANLLGKSEGNIRVLQYRALKNLATIMKKGGLL
ncbi:RNA polymerase sigma factor [Ureibacillus thermosphaericus]|uniref:RNA polymerase sigma factor n=1 Tax=Ureibacillus thermosphaericus TaxID=51173 RepID=A0A840PUZ3_URETH|nr:sigma-70 family RNA polymerase sigma factor [Ureibacillus thermosphaericus]MBB5150269.1 RNA polymerase sigma-70 factor (ECF subfamily) [Ureibacillus thermosphaericus]NKZ32880.1 sigma-70 family RNA polymerase sigma factor [Ureibacillus thermosphaericus]